MNRNIYKNLLMYKDCVSLINQMTNLVSVINSNRITTTKNISKWVDDKGWRSNAKDGTATRWEVGTCLKLVSNEIKGPINANDWTGKYRGNNIIITKKGKNSESHAIPISKVDEVERNERLSRRIPSTYRMPNYDLDYIGPVDPSIPQRTLLQSFDDLSNLIKVLGTLVATVGAVKSGVFATSIRNAVSKLSNSKKGLEQASKDIKTAVEKSKQASR